jgi:hypothetical protein
MLCRIGYITVPQQVLDKISANEQLTAEEHAVFAAQGAVAQRLIENIPRLDNVARIIHNQSSSPTLQERSDAPFLRGDIVTPGTAILRAALEFDRLVSETKSRNDALCRMQRSGLFSVQMLDALATAEVHSSQRKVTMVRVGDLDCSMVANQDICADNGLLLLPKGEGLTVPLIERLRAFAKSVGIPQPLSVLVPDSPNTAR